MKQYCRGACDRAHELGFELELFNLFDHGMSGRRLSQILETRGIAGAVIAPLSEGAGLSDVNLQWDSFALATIEHTIVEPRLHKVCNDEFSTISRLIQRLLDAGFARIGIAMHQRADARANHLWLAGHQMFQALTAEKNRIPHLITPHSGRDALLAWYKRWKPEAIITISAEAVAWLRDGGVRVPEDGSCATLYWKADRPFLSGFYQNHELMAAAVGMVVSQLNRNERGLPHSEKTILIQAEWREGETLRPLTSARANAAALQLWRR